jgi:hypothetical protein
MYELMGRAHASLVSERGQGTVEYVGLILLLAVLLAGVVGAASTAGDASSIAGTITKKLQAAIEKVG